MTERLSAYQVGVLHAAVYVLRDQQEIKLAASLVDKIVQGDFRPQGWEGFVHIIEFRDEQGELKNDKAGSVRVSSVTGRFQQAVSVAIGFLLYGPTDKMLRHGKVGKNGEPLMCPDCGSKRIDVIPQRRRKGKFNVVCEDCNARG